MNSNTHPELEQLASFTQNLTAPEHIELRRHLATCTDCRQRLEQLNTLSHNLLADPPASEAAILPDTLLQAIENGQLNDAQRRVLSDDPAALKAALHYAAHAPAMRRNFDSPVGSPAKARADTMSPDTNQPQSPGLLQRLLDWRPPAWGSIPLSAAAAFALALVVLPSAMSPSGTSPDLAALVIASYADQPVLALQGPMSDLPGIGFFHTADTQEIPFDGLRLRYSHTDGLSANWPPVENAQNYHLRLSRINTGGQQIVGEIDVNQSQARFPQLRPTPGRYQWLLTGQRADGNHFRASGGFVVNDL